MLLYPDGTIQHAGMALVRGSGIHVFRRAPRDTKGPFGMLQVPREVTALTGACMMVSKATLAKVGVFDERHAVVNNDVDFCLRCRAAGLRNVFTPETSLIHHEETSRADLTDDYDEEVFRQSWWREILNGDPYSHPHLTHDHGTWHPTSEPVELVHAGNPILGDARRILIVKADHLGDFIIARPAIERLRQHFPEARLTALVASGSVSFAKDMACLDDVIEFNVFKVRSGDGMVWPNRDKLEALKGVLTERNFDLAIDLRMLGDTRDLLRHSGATWLAGFNENNAYPWLDIAVEMTPDQRMARKLHHASDMLVHLVDMVASACEDHRPAFDPTQRRNARATLLKHPLMGAMIADDRPLIVIQPGAGTVMRQWPVQHFADLADLLVYHHDANIMLIGTTDEEPIATRVLDLLRNQRTMSVVGRTSMEELQLILKAADIMIGNNSGPHHMAAAIGTPTIGIHSGVVDAREWGPLGVNAVGIAKGVYCRPCYLERPEDCHRGLHCLGGVTVDQVIAASCRFIGDRK
jgi:O-antigen biosynthesis protein